METDNMDDLTDGIAKLQLEEAYRYPDGTKVTYGQLAERFQKEVANFFPDYENPRKVIILPRVDATKARLLKDDPCGKGSINEFNVRLIFEDFASAIPGLTYVLVCGHRFLGSKLQGNKTIFNDAINQPYKNIGEAKSFNREQDFILISPKCGLSFAEVKAFANDTDATVFIELLRDAKKQCYHGMLCMKAYIHAQIKQSCPSLFTDDLAAKLDSLFSRFAGFLIFPSLSKKVLEHKEAREEVEKLPKNFQVLFKEDREVPKEMIKLIERSFLTIQDQNFYAVVYKIALMCCFIMNDGMNRVRFTPAERTSTRADHLDQMERIFLAHQQNLVRESKQNVLFVNGVAGSGKTLICFAKMLDTAERYPDQGILFLCKNKNLAEHVRQELEKQKQYGEEESGMRTYDKVNVFSLLDWLQKICPNLPKRRGNNERTKEKSYVGFIRANAALINSLRQTYRHVFVDEYQDLMPGSRKFLQALFMQPCHGNDPTDNRTFYVFYDDMQSIDFVRDRIQQHEHVVVPLAVEKITLETVFRSPRLIAQYFTNYCQFIRNHPVDRSFSMGHEFDGLPVDVKYLQSRITMDQLLYETVKDVKQKHGLGDQDITVLYRSKDSIKKMPPGFQVNCRRLSLSDFKGLENKVIIFYDPRIIQKSRDVDVRVGQHYTVASRATWMYIILVKDKKARDNLNRMMNQGVYLLVGKDRFEPKKRHASGEADSGPRKISKAN